MLHRGTASLNQQVTFYSGPVAFSRRWVSLFWLALAWLCLRCISSRFTLITEPSNQKQHPETAAIGSSCSATPDCRIASDGWIALPLSFGKSTGSSRYTFTPVEPGTEAPWLMKRLEGVQSHTLKSSALFPAGRRRFEKTKAATQIQASEGDEDDRKLLRPPRVSASSVD